MLDDDWNPEVADVWFAVSEQAKFDAAGSKWQGRANWYIVCDNISSILFVASRGCAASWLHSGIESDGAGCREKSS
jgi:hypothetical protein